MSWPAGTSTPTDYAPEQENKQQAGTIYTSNVTGQWSSPRSETQASGWCCMHSTVLQILLIFSSPEGDRLQLSIPRAYFVYTVWHCTGQHCSSMYAFVCRYMAPPGECYYHTLCCDYFLSSSVVLCAFSAQCMYSTIGHHPHPLGYLCVKFCFFCKLHCYASPWRKIAYSITHAAYLMPRKHGKNSTASRFLFEFARQCHAQLKYIT